MKPANSIAAGKKRLSRLFTNCENANHVELIRKIILDSVAAYENGEQKEEKITKLITNTWRSFLIMIDFKFYSLTRHQHSHSCFGYKTNESHFKNTQCWFKCPALSILLLLLTAIYENIRVYTMANANQEVKYTKVSDKIIVFTHRVFHDFLNIRNHLVPLTLEIANKSFVYWGVAKATL